MINMNYAIKQLEETEAVLKETIDGLAEFEVEAKNLREKLLEVQTAIIVLQSCEPIIALAISRTLNTLQK